jgi:hypothetical protein
MTAVTYHANYDRPEQLHGLYVKIIKQKTCTFAVKLWGLDPTFLRITDSCLIAIGGCLSLSTTTFFIFLIHLRFEIISIKCSSFFNACCQLDCYPTKNSGKLTAMVTLPERCHINTTFSTPGYIQADVFLHWRVDF